MPFKDIEKRKAYHHQRHLDKKDHCKHGKQKFICVECCGNGICIHTHIKSTCRDCGGSQICSHGRMKIQCVDCKGSGICSHGRRKTYCIECKGSQICPHGIIKSTCRECGGSRFCNHNIHKRTCKKCNPILCIIQIQRNNIYRIMKQTNLDKTKPSIEYLGCSAVFFQNYIKSKMTEDMIFENIHYDHIKPVSVFDLENEDELLNCCHYSNFQPLLAKDNLSKNCKWNDEDEDFWNENIKGKEYLPLYFPRG